MPIASFTTPERRRQPPGAGKLGAWACAVLALLLFVSVGRYGGTSKVSRESQVKAAFVYKFLLFTEFPMRAFSSHTKTLSILIYGPHTFNGSFDPVEGKRVKGRLLHVREVPVGTKIPDSKDCHILFIGGENSGAATRSLIRTIQGRPILTVGEHESFLEWGGMIRLYRDSGRIAFEVNAESARKEGISFRAQMLRVARRVME